MGEKKVTVSSTPGKTKHFQTLMLNDEVTLCDCPGLVFPNFVATKAEMVCNGLLPIDQLRDCIAPTSLVCQRVRRDLLEGIYGIILPVDKDDNENIVLRQPTPYELLSAYGFIRGFMTASGTPDVSRSARYILKDYVNGLLRYVAKPPFKGKKEEDPYTDFDPQEGQKLESIVSKEKYEMLVKQRSSNLSSGGTNNAPREKKRADPKEKKYARGPTYQEKVTNPYDPNYKPPANKKLSKKDRKFKKLEYKYNRNKMFVPVDL